MKDYPYVPGWRLNKENNKPAIKHSVLMLTIYGIAEGEWEGIDWVQYRWSCKLKDSDVLYWIHLEDLQQLEKEGQPFQQEQPEVDLDSEFSKWWLQEKAKDYQVSILYERYNNVSKKLARHFYELARLKYEK